MTHSSITLPPIAMATSPMVGGVLPASTCWSVSASAKCQHTAENSDHESGSLASRPAASCAVRHGCTGGVEGDSPCVCESPLMSRTFAYVPASAAARLELWA